MTKVNEHDQATRKKFDRWAPAFDRWAFAFRYLQRRVLSLLDLRPGTSFLDLGCGTGWAVCRVAAVVEGQGRFVGIDISPEMIRKARENSRDIPGVEFLVASAEDLPLDNDSFDNVISTFSFHHYLNPDKALREAHRVLRPNGRLHILDGTPDDALTRWIDRMAPRLEKEHVKQYSTVEFQRLFSDAGLKPLGSRTILFYPVKVHIAQK